MEEQVFQVFPPLGKFSEWLQSWKWSKTKANSTQAIFPWGALGKRSIEIEIALVQKIFSLLPLALDCLDS